MTQEGSLKWSGFVLVHDGGCTYEEKARRVQDFGGHAMIVIFDEMAFIDGREFHDSDSRYDGTGHTIDIPTFIVNRSDGAKLLALLMDKPLMDESVILKADIDIADATSQMISYQLFYGSRLDLKTGFL